MLAKIFLNIWVDTGFFLNIWVKKYFEHRLQGQTLNPKLFVSPDSTVEIVTASRHSSTVI